MPAKQTIIICGTDSAIGWTVAERLSDAQTDTVLLSPAVDERQIDSPPDTEGVIHLEVDLNEPEAVEYTARRVRARYGHPEALVNIATEGRHREFRQTTPREARQLIERAYLSMYYLLWEFIEDLVNAESGQIITATPRSGYTPGPTAPLTAAHHALYGFTESLRSQLPPALTTSHIIYSHLDRNVDNEHQTQSSGNGVTPTALADKISQVLNTDVERVFLPPALEHTR